MSMTGSPNAPLMDLERRRVVSRSSAKMVMRHSLWAKLAALGALSALWVLKRRRRRWGAECCFCTEVWKADLARWICAFEGGLKDESRMKRVCGEGAGWVEGFIVRRMRNLEEEDWKDWSAEVRSGRRLRRELRGIGMVLLAIVWCCWWRETW